MSFMKNRKKDFKKAIDADSSRRAREETSIRIRKEKREGRLNQRRRFIRNDQSSGAPAPPNPTVNQMGSGQSVLNGVAMQQSFDAMTSAQLGQNMGVLVQQVRSTTTINSYQRHNLSESYSPLKKIHLLIKSSNQASFQIS